MVVVCVGMPITMNRITSAPMTCTANLTTARSVSMRLFSAVIPVNWRSDRNGCGLCGHADNDEQDHERADDLHGELNDRTQRIDALVLGCHPGELAIRSEWLWSVWACR